MSIAQVFAERTARPFFPKINEHKKEWLLTKEEHHSSDEKHAYAFSFLTYEKEVV